MANKVSFIIQLQDKFSRAAKSVNRQIKGIGKNSANAARIIKTKLAPSFKKLRTVATGAFIAIGASAAVAFKKMITLGADFQDSIANLSSITGSAGKDLGKLTDETFRLAKASSISQIEVANVFTQIASGKSELLKDPKSLSVVTEQVLLLANASGVALPDAFRASVGALNVFNKGADDAARFVNVVAAGAKVGASLVGETADALGESAAIAAQLNIPFEEINALIQVLAKNELKGAKAGTALKTTLSQLIKFMGGAISPSKVGIIKSLEVLGKLGLSDAQIIKDFGLDALTAILILRKNVPLVKQWTKELTGTNVAQEQASIRLSTFNAKMRRLGVVINESMIKTFLRLEPVLIKQVKSLSSWFNAITTEDIDRLSGSLEVLLNVLTLMAKALGLVAKGFKIIGTFSGESLAAINLATTRSESFQDLNRLKSTKKLSAPELEILNTGFLNSPNERNASEKLNDIKQTANKSVIEGEIVVSATKDTKIESTRLRAKSNNVDIGLNMVLDAAR